MGNMVVKGDGNGALVPPEVANSPTSYCGLKRSSQLDTIRTTEDIFRVDHTNIF